MLSFNWWFFFNTSRTLNWTLKSKSLLDWLNWSELDLGFVIIVCVRYNSKLEQIGTQVCEIEPWFSFLSAVVHFDFKKTLSEFQFRKAPGWNPNLLILQIICLLIVVQASCSIFFLSSYKIHNLEPFLESIPCIRRIPNQAHICQERTESLLIAKRFLVRISWSGKGIN